MKTKLALITLQLSGCVAAAPDPTPPSQVHATLPAVAARASPPRVAPLLAAAAPGNGIDYHGGAIMTTPPSVYFIWYGNWTGAPALTILPDFIRNLGGSYYYNINATYDDGSGGQVPNALAWGGSSVDQYSHGRGTLSGDDVSGIVEHAINAGGLPLDPHGIYLVLTSADLNQNILWGLGGSFCDDYCGWHNHTSINGQTIRYGFIGNPTRCPDKCSKYATTPNGDVAADAMASMITHEIEETATDPGGDAWYDANGDENADKCAWNFGPTYRAANGAWANLRLGTRDYLIQQNWVNAEGGFCALAYTGLTASVTPFAGGEVSSSPSGIASCGGGCEHGFPPGSTVTLTATPHSGYNFHGWQGCDSVNTTGQCRVTMNANRSVVASFSCATTLDHQCYSDCVSDCLRSGGLMHTCVPECRQECGGC
jgi:hypothetical protein